MWAGLGSCLLRAWRWQYAFPLIWFVAEMSGGVRNIRVNNCVFIGTDIGLRFKTQRGRGGVVEKIFVSNIRMTEIPTDAISFASAALALLFVALAACYIPAHRAARLDPMSVLRMD